VLSAGVSELHAGLCPDTFLDLDNAAAFECFKQNPAVIQLVSEGQMATALRAISTEEMSRKPLHSIAHF